MIVSGSMLAVVGSVERSVLQTVDAFSMSVRLILSAVVMVPLLEAEPPYIWWAASGAWMALPAWPAKSAPSMKSGLMPRAPLR